MALTEPLPSPDEILASIGPGGSPVATIDAGDVNLVAGGRAEGWTRDEARAVAAAFGVQATLLD